MLLPEKGHDFRDEEKRIHASEAYLATSRPARGAVPMARWMDPRRGLLD